jgi:adhesin/invasin
LPASIAAKVTDQSSNGIPGISVTFSDGGAGGSFSANPVTTDSSGRATTAYTTGTKAGPVTISATAQGLNPFKFAETVTAGAPATIAVVAGNGQTAPPSSQLPQALTVQVTDQFGNKVSGAAVSYSDGRAGGNFSANPVDTDVTGTASVMYTAPATRGSVTIVVSAGSASTSFTATIQ